MSALINGFEPVDLGTFEEGRDYLALIFNLQKTLMSACRIDELSPDIAFWVSQTALQDEVLEALVNFKDFTKPWKRDGVLDKEAVQEEVVDQLFFLVQSAILLGMDSEKMFQIYQEKYRKNFERILEKNNAMEKPL